MKIYLSRRIDGLVCFVDSLTVDMLFAESIFSGVVWPSDFLFWRIRNG